MAKKKTNLSAQEMDFIKHRQEHIGSLVEAVQQVSKFKQGDFLIAFRPATPYSNRTQITNSYGAAKKYTVVMVDKYGVPYMKELNKNGTPIGQLISPLRFEGGTRAIKDTRIEFEVDPDYTDAVIMADEENYDATHINKAKSDNFKEITKHNKSLKVKFKDKDDLLKFLLTLKVGDVFYKSIKTHFTITSLLPIPTTHNGKRVKEFEVFGTAQDSKGKNFSLDHSTFLWHAIYRGQPRSYNELKDPK